MLARAGHTQACGMLAHMLAEPSREMKPNEKRISSMGCLSAASARTVSLEPAEKRACHRRAQEQAGR